MVLNKRRDVENGTRALLREVGLKVGTPSRKDFPARVRDLGVPRSESARTADDPVLAGLAESLLAVIEVMTRQVGTLTKRVLDGVKAEPTCRMQGGISRRGDAMARTALYEAAHSLLTRSAKWPALRVWGTNVAKRRGMARPPVAVARKVAAILHCMWADGSEFRWGKQAAAPAATA